MIRCFLQGKVTGDWVCGILSTAFLILKHECFPVINIPNEKPENKNRAYWKLNSINVLIKY